MMKRLRLQNAKDSSRDNACVASERVPRPAPSRATFEVCYSSSDDDSDDSSTRGGRGFRRRRKMNWYDSRVDHSTRNDAKCIVEGMRNVKIQGNKFASNVSEVSSLSCLEGYSDEDCPDMYDDEDNSSTLGPPTERDARIQRKGTPKCKLGKH